MLWILKRIVSIDGSFELPKHMNQLMAKKIFTFLRSKSSHHWTYESGKGIDFQLRKSSAFATVDTNIVLHLLNV